MNGVWQVRLLDAWTRRGWLAWLLWPISLFYGRLVALRRWCYGKGFFAIHQAGVPVIVVGNVVAGGVGKTPVVMALVHRLKAQGWTVGVVSRGYGRTSRDCREVQPGSRPGDVGDEALLIHQRTGASVFVGRSRVEAARALLMAHPETQLIVSDDGLQHLALGRLLEICVFDDRGLGNGFLLPAGPLREPWPRQPVVPPRQTAATQWVLHTGQQPRFAGYSASRRLADEAIQADGSRMRLSDLAQQASSSGMTLAALAGIAQPEVFFAQLRARGLSLSTTQALPDHYDFDSWNRTPHKREWLICTEKDAVKLWRHVPDAFAVPLEVVLDQALVAAVLDRVAAALSSDPMKSASLP
jgi:tetraacyldisaccharide 4'-kinase